MTRSARFVSSLASLALVVCACARAPEPAPAPPPTEGAAAPGAKPAGSAASTSLEVPIEARSGSALEGTASFLAVEDGVKVTIQISGAPAGPIATHVHETGDCDAPDAKSAGDHFNPEQHPHGLPDGARRHLGDLGNIDVKADGTGTHEITIKGATLEPNAPRSYIGRAIIVHAKKDDGGQPSGNAGDRIGCGVITGQRP